MIFLWGAVAALFIGLILGLLGGGGSILTLPVLVYVFNLDAGLATVYSLFIVGVSSSIGAGLYAVKKDVSWRTVFFFGVTSLIFVFVTRKFLVTVLPPVILSAGQLVISRDNFLLGVFSILMFLAAGSMIRKQDANTPQQETKHATSRIVLQGAVVGFVTGLVGAGGGFLIIPALVNSLKLPMKKAIGTSLVIITVNGLAGFSFSLNQFAMDWAFLWSATGLVVAGILAGTFLSSRIPALRLKIYFGWFVLLCGLLILFSEIFL